jgi:hypothetical protein
VVTETDIAVMEAVLGSDLYRQCLRLREAVLRRPLGLTITREELADDATRQHFCALSYGVVVGSARKWAPTCWLMPRRGDQAGASS